MPTDRQALAALDDIDRILNERIGRPLTADGKALGSDDLSAEYWQIRTRLDTALTLVNKIPVYGRRIGTAVRFLMQICDRHCSPNQGRDEAHVRAIGNGHIARDRGVVSVA